MAAVTASADDESGNADEIFSLSERCIACHSNLSTASGDDVSIGYAWRPTMMANSGRDPYWHAAVRREVTDHPSAQSAIEDKCSTCHMPMMRFAAAAVGGLGKVFDNLPGPDADPFASDGVSCTVCHQIKGDNFGTRESFEGGFEIDAETHGDGRALFGPYDVDHGHSALMQSAGKATPTESLHLRRSELCATCHTLYTTALDDSGNVVGELPEQMPYLEWEHSSYRDTQSCQDCHMPVADGEVAITSVLGAPRERLAQHVFRGGNAFMLGILNRNRAELGVVAPPQEFDAARERTIEYLQTSTATLAIRSAGFTGGTLSFDVVVDSKSGHKLPTAYPSRRVWLHVTVADADGRKLFESGALRPNGSIVGNDNDADPRRYEPHYNEVTSPDQVQIYEAILGDPRGGVTTGLLTAVDYLKDNRVLPTGFEKTTAGSDFAVHGTALDDPDFIGGTDKVRYRLDLGGARAPLTVTTELEYQAVGFRWAENLGGYDTPETNRFVGYYREAVGDSATRLALATTTVR